ncbi:hypothetical protein DFR42_11256 [Undibacterium pigrum]|uniref:DUF4279 domain-containing protein n=2 Tax=Undibacterium pigrum TaxID=401470 RepID=A0A318ITM2_9BURK|nr:hypothetical protein DFR42_11256 [Undibacterium pigrum]
MTWPVHQAARSITKYMAPHFYILNTGARMKLLRFYVEVGGEEFDADRFALAADEKELDGAVSRISNNSKTLKRWGEDAQVTINLAGAEPPVNQVGSRQWCTGVFEYAAEEQAGANLPAWLAEEAQLLDFIEQVKSKLPAVASFCVGEYFILLRLVYATSGAGLHYSETLMRQLAEWNAGLTIDHA